MPGYRKWLDSWQAAGLVSPEQAGAIDRYEAQQAAAKGPQIPAIVEVLIYLGVSAVIGSLLALLSNAWEDLQTPARVVILALLSGAAGVAGAALRGEGNTPLTRASTILWVVSVGLAWGAGGAAAADIDIEPAGRLVLLIGAPATLLAVAYYAIERRALLLVVAVLSLVVQAFAGQDAVLERATVNTSALVLILLGAGSWALLEPGVMRPLWLAEGFAALFAMLGFFVPSVTDGGTWAEFVGLAAAGGVLWLSIQRKSGALLVVGATSLFTFVTEIIFKHLAESLGAPLALLLTGIALIGTAVMMIRLRKQTANRD